MGLARDLWESLKASQRAGKFVYVTKDAELTAEEAKAAKLEVKQARRKGFSDKHAVRVRSFKSNDKTKYDLFSDGSRRRPDKQRRRGRRADGSYPH